MKYLFTPYPDKLEITTYGLGERITIELVDRMQDKAHAQAQGRHAQAFAGYARTKGARKHNTGARRHSLSAKTNRLTSTQARAGYAQPGRCNARAHKWVMQCKHLGSRLVDVAVPCDDCCVSDVGSDLVCCINRSAKLRNRGTWPALSCAVYAASTVSADRWYTTILPPLCRLTTCRRDATLSPLALAICHYVC